MDCNVIKDLLPLYVDECCSKESAKLVSEHLDVCESCRKTYDQMQKTPLPHEEKTNSLRLRRVSDWKASVLQSVMLFVSFSLITFGVILEGSTPAGNTNGLWAFALIVPATGYLLSLSNCFFLRIYKNRKIFSACSCLATFGITLLGYGWAAIHYADELAISSSSVWIGMALSVVFCILSKIVSNKYALLLGRE